MTQRSCIWATHHSSKYSKIDDLLVVKERSKDENGVERSTTKFIKNYKRPYWITKPGCRDHTQKRMHESMDNLERYETTQSGMALHAAKILGLHAPNGYIALSEVNRSPYVYGTDVTSPVLVKQAYTSRWPDYMPVASIAAADYETDMINHHEDDQVIISGSICMKGKWVIAVKKSFIEGVPDPEVQFKRLVDTHLKDVFEKRKATIEFIICEDEIGVVKAIMGKAHTWEPDYLCFWNMAFDIKAMIKACQRANIDPAEIFCDPRIPDEFKKFRFVEDQQVKQKANGDKHSKDFVDLWHRVEAPASFYFVDPMAFYRMKRVAKGKRNSYSLDSIAEDTIGYKKLKLTKADDLAGKDWHIEMQRFHKMFYLVYNTFDCVLIELIDEKLKDISISLSVYCGVSEIKSAPSNPKRLADAGHFFLLAKNRVICSTSDDMSTPMDKLVLGRGDWIITLPAELVTDTGRSIVVGIPDYLSRISVHCGDIDVASSYPTTGTVLNVSSSTTRVEVYQIEGLTELELRQCAVNMTAIPTNAVELGKILFKLPDLHELEQYF